MSDERKKRIREHAYRLWEEEGRPADRALDHWIEAERQHDEGATDQANEGEGNRTAARAYNRKAKIFAENGPVEGQARKAEAELDGSQGDALRAAEAAGRSHSHGEDPDVIRRPRR